MRRDGSFNSNSTSTWFTLTASPGFTLAGAGVGADVTDQRRKEIESERMVAYCLCKVATVGRGYLRNARLYLYDAGSAILILRLI